MQLTNHVNIVSIFDFFNILRLVNGVKCDSLIDSVVSKWETVLIEAQM